MSALDRDKAREVLGRYSVTHPINYSMLLDALARCVTDERNAIEGRDWIDNPDGTLVYWQAEAEEARAKLAAIVSLCDAADATSRAAGRLVRISADSIRAVLAGGAR